MPTEPLGIKPTDLRLPPNPTQPTPAGTKIDWSPAASARRLQEFEDQLVRRRTETPGAAEAAKRRMTELFGLEPATLNDWSIHTSQKAGGEKVPLVYHDPSQEHLTKGKHTYPFFKSNDSSRIYASLEDTINDRAPYNQENDFHVAGENESFSIRRVHLYEKNHNYVQVARTLGKGTQSTTVFLSFTNGKLDLVDIQEAGDWRNRHQIDLESLRGEGFFTDAQLDMLANPETRLDGIATVRANIKQLDPEKPELVFKSESEVSNTLTKVPERVAVGTGRFNGNRPSTENG